MNKGVLYNYLLKHERLSPNAAQHLLREVKKAEDLVALGRRKKNYKPLVFISFGILGATQEAFDSNCWKLIKVESQVKKFEQLSILLGQAGTQQNYDNKKEALLNLYVNERFGGVCSFENVKTFMKKYGITLEDNEGEFTDVAVPPGSEKMYYSERAKDSIRTILNFE